jgi:hypothetical protein
MKLKFAAGLILSCGVSAAANAAPAVSSLSLSGVLLPLTNVANLTLPALNPVLQPVLTQTGPVVGAFIGSLHPGLVQLAPLFTTVDSLAGVVVLPSLKLPGLPD